MKVLFISRSTLFTSPGGDTKQIEMTAVYLRKLGVEVDIRLAKDDIDYSSYDLLHFFNIIRPADLLFHAQKSGKPFVTSTIFLEYGEYEKNNRKGILSIVNKIFSEDFIEYAKVLIRNLKNAEPIKSKLYIIWGHRKSIRYLIRHSKVLLPNSENEYKRLVKRYGIEQKYVVVPNAIDTITFSNQKNENDRNILLCVARIEGRKNQLNLIRAVRNTPYELYIIGKPSPNHDNYYQVCKKEAAPNIHFLDHMPQEEIRAFYSKAKVHILPSWFETTGLSSLEAAVMGCNIVVTDKGDTREYFGDLAFYCNPDDPTSIRKAIENAFKSPFREELRQLILTNYIWEKAAEKTVQAYKVALA